MIAEPGRYLVSDAGYFVCRVIGTATRGGKRWMHWDAGLFGGVIETTEGLKYKIRTDAPGPDVPWHVAGPTCDSVDVVLRDEPLPSDLQEGDFIYIRNAGAYTTAYASKFNGFPLPEVRVFESRAASALFVQHEIEAHTVGRGVRLLFGTRAMRRGPMPGSACRPRSPAGSR